MTVKPKPCPNRECLSGDSRASDTSFAWASWVSCPKCGMSGPLVEGEHRSAAELIAEAIRLWNNLPRGVAVTDLM